MIKEVMAACTIPVMAKARIGHFAEAQILEALGIDYIGVFQKPFCLLTAQPLQCVVVVCQAVTVVVVHSAQTLGCFLLVACCGVTQQLSTG